MSNDQQADKFREAARDLDCDLDEEAFDRALGRVARADITDSKESEQAPSAKKKPARPSPTSSPCEET